jgi:hypothetical protein
MIVSPKIGGAVIIGYRSKKVMIMAIRRAKSAEAARDPIMECFIFHGRNKIIEIKHTAA